MTARILIHVQHLLGTGHLKRAAAIARALDESGFAVEIASGGPPLAELDCGGASRFQLPSLRAADGTFKTLVDDHGRVVDEAWKAARREQLLQRFAETRPDVLITELFPFGRRMLEFELMPLLEAARARTPRPLILCSLRDVLIAPREAAKVARAVERARALYDHILVHGDPALIDLPASYPATRDLCDRITYTGYVAAPPAPEAPAGEGEDEVIVSAGGGAVGGLLLKTAAALQARSDDGRRWRLLIGSDVPPEIRQRLHAAATARLIVEPARRDFPSLLRRCHVSISQAGYNTVMDILDARAPAVLVPFAAHGETEQTTRAAALAARGWAELLPEEALSPAALAGAISSAVARGRPDTSALRRSGADETVRVVRELRHARGRA
jgi:predicted glycosyltransferase